MSTLASQLSPVQQATGSVAGTAPGYVAPKARLDALRERARVRSMLRDLHEGKWRKVLINLQVSQYAWPKLQQHSGKIAELLTKVNLVRLAWTMHATVLVGNMPTISVPDGFEMHRAFLATLERTNQLDAFVFNIARTINVEAEAAVRVDIHGDRVALYLDDNDRTLPVGPDGPDTQPSVWERRWVIERPNPVDRHKPRKYLRVERHRMLAGRAVIEQEAYETKSDDTLLPLQTLRRVDLETAGVTGLADSIDTGAGRPLITRFVQDYFNGEPQFSIQENDLDIIDTVTAAISRLARTHAIHARPKVRVPEEMIDRRTGEADLTKDVFVDPERQYEYVTIDAKLAEMLDFMDRMSTHLLTVLEMSGAIIGHKIGGGSAPDSFDKLRLEATPTLARGKRSASFFGPALEHTLTTASEVDASLPLRGYAVGPINAKMRPQLPKDDVDLARELAEMRRDNLIDHRSALAQLHGEDRADAMLAAIEEDGHTLTSEIAELKKAGLIDEQTALERVHGEEQGQVIYRRILRKRRREQRQRRLGDVHYELARQELPLVTRLSGEQLRGVIDIAKSIGEDGLSEEMALGMLVGLGFPEDLARRMVGAEAGISQKQEQRLLEGVL